ncbi:MAG: YciI family protein [Pseudolabrys sp.]|nr:YciI family protein [Pseudolabrys sp.]
MNSARGTILATVHSLMEARTAKLPNNVENLQERAMPKFVAIGYGDQDGYDRTVVAVREAAHKQDAQLQKDGALMGIAGTPVQVRNPTAKQAETTEGPFMSSSLPVAGFAIIEAGNLADAIEKVSRTPCAVAQGVVEVWPLRFQ